MFSMSLKEIRVKYNLGYEYGRVMLEAFEASR